MGAVHNLEGCYIFILCVATKKVFKEARQAIKNANGCTLLDEREDGGYVTPRESAGNDDFNFLVSC